MKRITIVIVLALFGVLSAESLNSLSLLGGYGYTKYYQGGAFGIRYEKNLNNYVSLGVETISGINVKHTEAERNEDADYMRLHAVLRLSTNVGKFEPYFIGNFGKGITAENLQDFPELSAAGTGESRANHAWGGGFSVGVQYNFSNMFLGFEWGMTSSVLDYGQAILTIGSRF